VAEAEFELVSNDKTCLKQTIKIESEGCGAAVEQPYVKSASYHMSGSVSEDSQLESLDDSSL